MPTFSQLTGVTKSAAGSTDLTAVNAAIAHLQKQVRRETRLPEDHEIDGSWTFWVKYLPRGNEVDYQLCIWIGENNAVTFGPETFTRAVTPATYNPTTGLYTTQILGSDFSYAIAPVTRVGNQYFSQPILPMIYPGGQTSATEWGYHAYNAAGELISNGGGVLNTGDNLMAIRWNDAIARIVYNFKPLGEGTDFIYEVTI
jgi:hypothetical protein